MEFFTSWRSAAATIFVICAIIGTKAADAVHEARIDTHQHFVPDFYAQQLKELNYTSGGAVIPDWSEATALWFMESSNITRSIVSISAPGAFIVKDDVQSARLLARRLNEYGHGLEQRNPEKFGFFATLTLPDVEGSVMEAMYALDVLQASGVVLMAQSNGIYVGDASLDPLMEVLNQREAVVFIHPDSLPGPAAQGIHPFIADFLLDTTRAAVNLLLSDKLTKYPNITYILSHAGGFLPYAAFRIAGSVGGIKKVRNPTIMAQMKSFYFDTALSATATVLPSLLTFNHEHIVYGSDFPFAAPASVTLFNNVIASFPGLSAADRDLLNHVAAAHLFESRRRAAPASIPHQELYADSAIAQNSSFASSETATLQRSCAKQIHQGSLSGSL